MKNITGEFKKLFSNFKGDLFGGITAAVIALPLALAFGVASGVGAAAGLYGAIFVGLFASVFGGTKPQISGPTGPITVVVAAIVASNPGNLKLIFATILLAGIFQILLGISKVGNFIRFVPYPVISGFMSGIGVIIIILQINPLLGLDVQGTPIKTLLNIGEIFNSFNLQSLILGLSTLIIVFYTPSKIKHIIPPSLIALISITIASVLLDFNVKRIGEIPTGMPDFQFPVISFEDIVVIIPLAITVAILGSVDSLLTSLVSDSLTKETHNSNKELIGQGIGNTVSALFGGIAGAGATMRTVINIKTGGKTPLSGIIHAIFLLALLLGAAPLASNIPMAVLAGILIKVGFDIIDYKFIKVINHAPRQDLAVMILVFVLTVFDDLIFAVGAGIVLSCLLFASKISKKFKITIDEYKQQCANQLPEEHIEKLSKYKIRMVNIDGEFFFGSASRVLTRVDDLLGTEYLIINCESIPDMDISAVFALEDIVVRMQDKGIKVFLVLANKDVTKNLLRLGVMKLIGRDNIYYNKCSAVDKAREIVLGKSDQEFPAQTEVNV